MTTVDKPNIHALAIDGAFDDCQRIVKELFGDLAFRDEMRLSGVNSTQLGAHRRADRVLFRRAVSLGAPERPISFAVPTGNFGDVLAGYYAKRMGLPIDRLIIATNENDILVRALATGRYAPKAVKATQSPSMDIQVSSNFERLLFEASSHNPAAVVAMMRELAGDGGFAIPSAALARIRADFDAFRVDEAACAVEMGQVYRQSGMVIDPHSAVGVCAARKALEAAPATPVIALGTAHPAKFPDAVSAPPACGRRCRSASPVSWIERRRLSYCPMTVGRWPTTCVRLREPRRERSSHEPPLGARRSHRGRVPCEDGCDRRLRRRRFATRERRRARALAFH